MTGVPTVPLMRHLGGFSLQRQPLGQVPVLCRLHERLGSPPARRRPCDLQPECSWQSETMGDVVKQDPSMFLTRGRLMLEVPVLRAKLWGFLQENEAVLCQVFAAQSGRDPEDFELRVAAGAIIGAIMAALTEWIRSDGQTDMVALLDRALHLLEAGLASVGTNPHTP